MAKANRKAMNIRDMEIILFGNVPHPTNKQIKNVVKNLKHIQRQNTKAINTSTFVSKRKKRRKCRDKMVKLTNQILRGFDIIKGWKEDYEKNQLNKNGNTDKDK